MSYKYLLTKDAMTVVLNGKPYVVSNGHQHFDDIVKAVWNSSPVAEILGVMERQKDAVMGMLNKVMKLDLGDSLVYDDGVIYYNGVPVENSGAHRLVAMIEMGHDYTALSNFIKRLADNPLPHVVNELFSFLEHGKVPLTAEGNFLVYKAVRADYRDIYTGTFLNSVGQVVNVDRGSVDPDRNQTCSRGLHVCSFAYLPSFASANGHVMICRVDPADVVAVPSDYNNTKMRVCRYEVVGEVTSYYKDSKDVLAEQRLASLRYEVRYYDDFGVEQVDDVFYTVGEALAIAAALRDELLDDRVRVVDLDTNKEVAG